MFAFSPCSLILSLALIALCRPAATEPAAGPPAGTAPQMSATYTFVPGDMIDVTVSGYEGYDRTLTIQPDGRIEYHSVGAIVAAGLTPAQLAARIQAGLNVELVDPQVTVSLKEKTAASQPRVSVLGAVKSPGVYELKQNSTLTEVLATAGGPTPVADMRRINITRPDTAQQYLIDLSNPTRSGAQSEGPSLASGDLIFVPAGAPPNVTVMGEVTRPGSYEIQGSSRVMDAISQAGGVTPQTDLAHVKLVRNGQVQILDLLSVATGRANTDSTANPSVLPGDLIELSVDPTQVYLLGAVAKPSAYPFREGDHLLDLLTRAGGTTSDADARKAVLFRREAGGQPVAQPFDLSRLLAKGDMRANLALRQGDVIMIPSQRNNNPSALSTLLYPLTGLLNLFHF